MQTVWFIFQYGLKKKEEIEREKAEEAAANAALNSAGRISREKKTPAQIQAEMEEEEESKNFKNSK